MIPIGGIMTMNIEEALDAVRMLSPEKVIPCHYDCDIWFQRRVNPADPVIFKKEVKKTGAECIIIKYEDEIIV